MFAFCTKRFHMSEAVAARRIRAGRATCRFPCILGMVARGELHLSGIHQLAGHLTDENHEEVLRRAKHKSMREIERLVAEVSPKPDVRSSIRALPVKAALTDRPRSKVTTATKKTRAIPARVRREGFERDAGQCRFVDCEGRRCESTWKVEFHHRVPYARGGSHSAANIQLRCRAHNQYEAELEYGELFMVTRRRSASPDPPGR